MSLLYIIDGCNVVNHESYNKLKNTSSTFSALARLINIKRLCGKNSCVIVFDGHPHSKDAPMGDDRMEVIFSKSLTADERIKQLIEKRGNPKNMVVVSDDNEVKFYAKSAGAKAMGVRDFLEPAPKSAIRKDSSAEQELSYSQMEAINKELKRLWLKQ
jgi:hypothetical protein